MSSKALKTIAVDDIESIPPRKMLLMWEKPSDMPVPYPTNIIPATIVTAAVTAVPPTLSSLRNENSSPMAKSRKMTPMSAHTRMLDASETVGMNDTEGACQHAGHDVAENDGLAQSLEDERRTAGRRRG